VTDVFPTFVIGLPRADIALDGLVAYLLQGQNHQVLFMQFDDDVEVPVHTHESQWSVVLRGCIDISLEGSTCTYGPGDSYFVSRGVAHSARIHAGYADITFFDQRDRYKIK
jgi:quercetin dioxygenase-like cupin family protein